MELKIALSYEQILAIVQQLPSSDLSKLYAEIDTFLEKRQKNKDISAFQAFLLTAPTMTDEEYESFVENRKTMNKWRSK